MNAVVIRSGLLYDGKGGRPQLADILVQDGKVAAIGNFQVPKGAKTINAKGKWVMPGFIDLHTHYDAEVEVMPGLEESIRHGVTTVIFGNCSLSCALGSEEDLVNLFCRVENLPADIVEKWIRGRFHWKSPSEYYGHLEKLNLGPNVASFLGHSEVRMAAMGLENALNKPKATRKELKKMKSIIAEAMKAGFIGFSIDLLPFHRMFKKPYAGVSVPSQQASHWEYSKLAKVVRKHGKVLQAVPNALSKLSVVKIFSLSTGLFRRKLRTTVIAAMDTKSDRKVYILAPLLAKIFNRLFRADLKWQALPEPFLNYADGPITPLFEEFPSAVKSISVSPKERMALFRNPEFRAQFRKEWEHKGAAVFHRDLSDMWIVNVPGKKNYIGRAIADVAKAEGKDPLEFFMDLIATHDRDFRWKSEITNDREEIRVKLLADSVTLPGFSDSGAHNRNMAFYDFALQTLQQAQKFPSILPVEEAVARLTSRIADFVRIDAGTIGVGKVADITIVDPDKLKSGLGAPVELKDRRLQGAMRMVKRSNGVVNQVLVGGEVVFDGRAGFHRSLHKKRFGRLLRSAVA